MLIESVLVRCPCIIYNRLGRSHNKLDFRSVGHILNEYHSRNGNGFF